MIQDNDFIFDGRHSRADMGLICVKKSDRVISAPMEVMSYSIGGMNGTQVFGDRIKREPYTVSVTLYAINENVSETNANLLWQQTVDWLMTGRRALIWDSEQNRECMAEVQEISGTMGTWIEEGLKGYIPDTAGKNRCHMANKSHGCASI